MAMAPVSAHDAATISSEGDGVGEGAGAGVGVDAGVASGVGRTMAEEAGVEVVISVGPAAVEQAAKMRLFPINAAARNEEWVIDASSCRRGDSSDARADGLRAPVAKPTPQRTTARG